MVEGGRALIDAGLFTNPDMAPRALGLVEQLAPLVKVNNGAWMTQADLTAGG